ncbi:hypothetical protein NMG60_11035079 [Bertholletia excelsa]
MASEKAKSELSGSNSCNGQECAERSANSRSAQCHLEKALLRRALFGSSHRRTRGRQIRTNDARSPSRLSRVSLADEAEN